MSRTSYQRHIPNIEAIPKGMRDLKIWVTWKLKPSTTAGKKPGKVPFDRNGSSNWRNDGYCVTLEEAMNYASEDKTINGIGIVLGVDPYLCGGDIDHCIDENGEISDMARSIIDAANTYTEITPSGKGLRFFFNGSFGGYTGNNQELGVEFYEHKRFLTFSGDYLEEYPFSIEERDLTELGKQYHKLSTKSTKECHVPDNWEPVDLEQLNLSKALIKKIKKPTITKSRSEYVYGISLDLLDRSVPPETIARILSDPSFGVSEKALEERGGVIESAMEWAYKYAVMPAQEEKARRFDQEIAVATQSAEIAPSTGYKSSLTKDWVFVTATDEWFNVKTGEKMSTRGFNLVFKHLAPSVSMRPNGQPSDKAMNPDISVYLISYCGARTVSDTLYMPMMGETFEMEGKRFANTYMASQVPKANKEWEKSPLPGLIRGHLEKIFTNQDEVDILVQWMAWIVQNPGKKIRWAPLLIGEQGDGKSQIGTVMGYAMGSMNVKSVSQQELHENFNGWSYGHCLAVLEEIKAVGKSRHDVSEKLKTPITNPNISVLRKGRDGVNAPNTQNYLALTNHRDAIIIEETDRRWFVMQTIYSVNRVRPADELDFNYWNEYFKKLEQDDGSIRGWLLNVDTSKLDISSAPKSNAAKEFMKQRSRSGDASDALELIELGGGWGYTDNVVCTDEFAQAYKNTYGHVLRANQVQSALHEIGFIKVERVIKWKGKSRRVYVKLGFLDKCSKDPASENRTIISELNKSASNVAADRKEMEELMKKNGVHSVVNLSPYEHVHFAQLAGQIEGKN